MGIAEAVSGRFATAKPHRIKASHRRRWKRASAHREYQHTDALGSPVAITNSSKTVTERREFEPYGYQTSPALADGPNYTGHVADAATGLIYMQQRYYDPSIGRTLSRDPVTAYGTGDMRYFNAYAYAFNNPYKFSDPDGRCPTCDRNSDQYARDAAAGNTGVYAPFAKPALVVATAALPLAPAARGIIGLVNTVRSLLNRQEAPRVESKTRAEPGADGGKSTITREIDPKSGDTLSTRHTVERGGEVVHQHQDHMGKAGSVRTFSDQLTGTKTVGEGKQAPTPKDTPPNFPREPAKGSRY